MSSAIFQHFQWQDVSMGQPDASPLSYRMVPRARLGLLLAGVAIAVLGFFMVGPLGVLFGLAVGAGLYFWSASWGVTLTPDALVIDSVLHKKVAWSTIQGIDYNISRLGTASTVIDNRGKVWILRAPTTSPLAPDPLMLKAMTEIENYWKIHRGTQWRPNATLQSILKEWARTNNSAN